MTEVLSFSSRFTGRRKEERRESLPCGDLSINTEAEAYRRPSFLRIVSLGKLKRESMSDKSSQEGSEETVEEEPVVKAREPLSGNKHYLFIPSILQRFTELSFFRKLPCLS